MIKVLSNTVDFDSAMLFLIRGEYLCRQRGAIWRLRGGRFEVLKITSDGSPVSYGWTPRHSGLKHMNRFRLVDKESVPEEFR